jgi:hypothetical protein
MYAFCAVLAVVSEALQDLSERLHSGPEICLTAVVFEAHNAASADTISELESVIADHSGVASLGVEIYRTQELAFLSVMGLVIMAHHLISAANAEEGFSVLDGSLDIGSLSAGKIFQENSLLEVLSAAYEENIEVGERHFLSEMKLDNLGFDAAPYETLLQAEGISSVAVKIKHLRIEVAYFK